MLAQPQGDLVEHGIIGPRFGEADQVGHQPVEIARQIARLVVGGAITGVPQIHEQRIVAIGAALVLAVGLGLLGLAHRLFGNAVQFLGLGLLGGKGGIGRKPGCLFGGQRRQPVLLLFQHLERSGPPLGQRRAAGVKGADRLFGLADILGMGLEHVARPRLGPRNLSVQLGLHGRVEPQPRQLPEQLGFLLPRLAQPLGGARHALGQFVLFAPDVAHGFFETGKGLWAANAHGPTTASPRRPEPARRIEHQGNRRTCGPPDWPG
ncbi:hypothetical protein D3C87_1275710 [compost metagenome]